MRFNSEEAVHPACPARLYCFAISRFLLLLYQCVFLFQGPKGQRGYPGFPVLHRLLIVCFLLLSFLSPARPLIDSILPSALLLAILIVYFRDQSDSMELKEWW